MKNLSVIVFTLISCQAFAEPLEIQCRDQKGNVLTYNSDNKLTIESPTGEILVDLENMITGRYKWVEWTMVSPIFHSNKGPASLPYGTIYESREGTKIKIKGSTFVCDK